MATKPNFDETKGREFTQKVIGDLSGAMATLMCILGDRLNLFKELAANGPATSEELATRAQIDERYAREWLHAMVYAGYLEYESNDGRFTLPPEHAPVVAQEGGRVFLGGLYQFLPAMLGQLDEVTKAFRQGGGVSQAEYGPSFWEGLERYSASAFENLMLQRWIPAVPEVKAKLEAGVSVADIGCGAGRALIKLAQEFPNSNFVGYDIYAPSIATATARAKAANVEGRVRFERQDISSSLPQHYDIITTFDVVHDAADPRGLLRSIRNGLREDGAYLIVDVVAADK